MQICQDAECDSNCVDYYIWTVNRSSIVFFNVGDDIINGDLVRIVVINTIGKKERPIVPSERNRENQIYIWFEYSEEGNDTNMIVIKKKQLAKSVAKALPLTVMSLLLFAKLKKGKSVKAVHLKKPRRVMDPAMASGQKVTWDCVWFGSYPQREVIADESSYDAVFRGDDSDPGYYNKETDVIEDAELFSELENATGWDKHGDITIGNSKYRRLKTEDATYGKFKRNVHYNNVIKLSDIGPGVS